MACIILAQTGLTRCENMWEHITRSWTLPFSIIKCFVNAQFQKRGAACGCSIERQSSQIWYSPTTKAMWTVRNIFPLVPARFFHTFNSQGGETYLNKYDRFMITQSQLYRAMSMWHKATAQTWQTQTFLNCCLAIFSTTYGTRHAGQFWSPASMRPLPCDFVAQIQRAFPGSTN